MRITRTGADTGLTPWRSDVEQGRKRLHRLYVIAAAGLAALVPLILFAGFWVRAELHKSERDVETYLAGRASTLLQRVDGTLEQQLLALQAVSALPALDNADPGFAETASRIAAALPNWTGLAIVDVASGQVIAGTRPDWPAPQALPPLAAIRDSREPAIRAVFPPGSGTPDVFLAAPVVRAEAVRFALVAGYDGAELQRLVASESRESGLLTVITEQSDRILARSRAPEAHIGQDASPSYRAAIRGQASGLFQGVSRDGQPVSSAFVRSGLTGWVALSAIDREQVDKFSKRSVWATIAAGALSLILAGILAVFIVHTVMERRVSDERLAASRALGELDARLLKTTQEALGEQRKASSEREVLLREIYHRVKNNLQIVQSLLRLGSRELSLEQREPFESAVRRIGAMARVHTLLYNSPDLGSIDFKIYLDEVLKELADAFDADQRGVETVLDAESMRVPLDTAVPLAFIAVELLTNAYRHAFPQGRRGRVTVELKGDEPFGVLGSTTTGLASTAKPHRNAASD
jgi:two-component sensor histidine kinase